MGIAIVTGASSGIGQELVRQLGSAAQVDEIWAVARRAERLQALNGECRLPVRAVPLDLSDTNSFAMLAEMLKNENRQVSVLINCAGYGKFGAYHDIAQEEALGMIDLNCRALVGVTNCVLPFMPDAAKILQVCSISAFQPLPLANVYAASKAFVLQYARALAVELEPRHITVTALCPGWVKTDFFATATDTKNPGAVTKYPFMQTTRRVAAQGLAAMQKGRLISIVGKQNKLLYVASRLFPVRFVMHTWLKTQK